MQKEPKKIIAVMSDLFFTVKVTDAAKRAGMALEFATDEKAALAKAQEKPAVMIFDLNFDKIQPLKVIGKIKSNAELKSVNCIGFLSHIQGELKQQAQEIGCDMVMARSAFSQNLPQILKRHSGHV